MATRNSEASQVELLQEQHALAQACAGLQRSRNATEELMAQLHEGQEVLAVVQRAASGMDSQLSQERQALAAMRAELERTIRQEQLLRQGSEEAVSKADAARDSFEAECRHSLSEARATEEGLQTKVRELQAQLDQVQRAPLPLKSAQEERPPELRRLTLPPPAVGQKDSVAVGSRAGRAVSFAAPLAAPDDPADDSSLHGAVRVIPEAYAKVIEQIASVGWDRMQWARGFTLLHWAAKNNIPELCARFLFQGADPHQTDVTGRSAFDYAWEQDPPSCEALAQLERGKPMGLPELPPFATSQQSRKSKAVIAVPQV